MSLSDFYQDRAAARWADTVKAQTSAIDKAEQDKVYLQIAKDYVEKADKYKALYYDKNATEQAREVAYRAAEEAGERARAAREQREFEQGRTAPNRERELEYER